MFKKWWKYSRLRFYKKNFLWNIRFWLYAKAVYKPIIYQKGTGEYVENQNVYDMNYMVEIKETVTKKRFSGYYYDNGLYLDNPGFPIRERDVWVVWKKKGLLP